MDARRRLTPETWAVLGLIALALDYLALLEVVEKLREKEEAKVEVRGNGELSAMAEDFLRTRR